MIRKITYAVLLVVLLSQFAVPSAFAAAGRPAGGCAPGFTIMEVMDHDQHEHTHVGTDADQNGDGLICMTTVTPGNLIHVHVDNAVP